VPLFSLPFCTISSPHWFRCDKQTRCVPNHRLVCRYRQATRERSGCKWGFASCLDKLLLCWLPTPTIQKTRPRSPPYLRNLMSTNYRGGVVWFKAPMTDSNSTWGVLWPFRNVITRSYYSARNSCRSRLACQCHGLFKFTYRHKQAKPRCSLRAGSSLLPTSGSSPRPGADICTGICCLLSTVMIMTTCNETSLLRVKPCQSNDGEWLFATGEGALLA
jgi:hypothetical protein